MLKIDMDLLILLNKKLYEKNKISKKMYIFTLNGLLNESI